jgi:hypothetical protein
MPKRAKIAVVHANAWIYEKAGRAIPVVRLIPVDGGA